MSSTEAKTVVPNTSDGETSEMDEAKTVAPKTSDGETFEVDEVKTVVLKTSDGEKFEVEEEVVIQSLKIKHVIEKESASTVISLPNVSSGVMTRVIEYCRCHAFGEYDYTMKDYDAEFVKIDNKLLFELISVFFELPSLYFGFFCFGPGFCWRSIWLFSLFFVAFMAAHYLNIPGKLDVTCQAAANMLKGKTPEEIRATYNITNDLTPEEEEEIREYWWAFGQL
ncbi:SKP1-like protein 4 [Striga hermonthica]|uniref:SKP1-like protein 4 n=1 Tax=Striga hermonthica TaxID=68872 RepID=A0A9N7RRQ1_STRHE|nr:SKP1-like protein 4 [Striga hermonthica]